MSSGFMMLLSSGALHQRRGRVGDRHREGVMFHALLGDGHRRDAEIELLRFQARQDAGPRQIEIGDLDAHLLADCVDEIAVEPLVGSVVGDIERRELHLGRGRKHAALLDLRQRIVGEGGACGAEQRRSRRRSQPVPP